MNRRQFLKKSLEGIVLGILLISSCSKNPVLEDTTPKDISLPIAKFTASPLSGLKPLEVSFDASESYDNESKITHYLWDFDGDGQGDSFEPVDKFVYQEVGTFHPKLIIFNEAGLIAAKDTTVVVHFQGKIDLEDIFIDKSIIADYFGFYSGHASESELNFIDNYFKTNPEIWAFGAFPFDYKNKNEIPLSEIINIINGVGLWGPHKSEDELRKYYETVTIGTSWMGVYVFAQDNVISEKCKIKYCYKTPGPNFSREVWTPMIIENTVANDRYVELFIKTYKDIYTWQSSESGKVIHIQGTLKNISKNRYYSKVGDRYNSASEQDLLLIAENSAGSIEKYNEVDNLWYEVKNVLALLIEGSKFVSIKPPLLYYIYADLSIKENEEEKGIYRFRIDYYDNENPDSNTLPYWSYSNTFEIK